MKKQLFFAGLGFILVAGVQGCKKNSFLDQTTTESLNEQIVFADSAYTFNFLNNIYSYLGQDVRPDRSTYSSDDNCNLEDMTTQSVGYYAAPQTTFIQGTATANLNPFYQSGTNAKYGVYNSSYTAIRAANLLMKNLPSTPLADATKVRIKAEARFLRAFMYAQMVRLYGGVPLLGDEPLDISTIGGEEYKRSTFKACIDYIADECDAAAKDLPSVTDQQVADYGRITSGACIALKARMLLMAASPLLNGSPASTDAKYVSLLSYSAAYDASLWQKAADACKAVMNLNQYSLNVDNTVPGNGFRSLFLKRQNTEYILPYMVAPNTTIESNWFPLSRNGGGGGYSTPSQNLVEQFGMKNGLSINDPNSGYNADKPYENRDPRFYNTIVYNQAILYNPGSQKMDAVNIYNVVTNGISSPYDQDGVQQYHTRTGYYCRKMGNDSVRYSVSQNRVYPVIRYAEILLGYAEALNESAGPVSEVYALVRQIRNRAGITAGSDNSYGVKDGLTKEAMRALIQNEYRVELAYEGHWFYDCRRWKTAETEESKPISGMLVTKQANGSFTYATFTVLNTVFRNPIMYFMPFPMVETGKGMSFIQNPGW